MIYGELCAVLEYYILVAIEKNEMTGSKVIYARILLKGQQPHILC